MNRLEQSLQVMDRKNTDVSAKGVDWHVDHSLKVINGVLNAMEASDPKNYKGKTNLIKMYVMTTGKIPRGKAKAPKKVSPPEDIDREKVKEQFDKAQHHLKHLDEIHPDQFSPHPIFGDLKKKKALKFLGIHTRHHLKIIDDILQS